MKTQEKVTQIVYKVVKYNKTSTIYQFEGDLTSSSLLTEFVKVEVFQGYSKAYNLGLYFRIKDQSSWSKSKQVTGLWRCNRKGFFYGDYKKNNRKTLLIFKIDEENQSLTVYEYPFGYYPSKTKIDSIVNHI